MPKKTDTTTLEQLVTDLRAAHADNLASVVLYGSAAAGDHIQLRSDHNLLIALRRITAEDLHASQAPMRQWQDLGQPMPVYFTVAELQDAADVFPIEFLQMEKARKVLYGSDLRHQTEYELRTKLISLRRLYIRASVSVEKLSALMSDSLGSFAALFRAVMILLGHDPPVAKPDSVRAAVRLLELDAAPFEQILELRTGKGKALTERDANNLFSAYMAQIERVIEAVNRIEGE